MDLAPGRSLVERAVRSGHTVFMIAPDPGAGSPSLTISDYLARVRSRRSTSSPTSPHADHVDVVALYLGGTLATATAAWYAAAGRQRVIPSPCSTPCSTTPAQAAGVFADAAAVDRLERTISATATCPARG